MSHFFAYLSRMKYIQRWGLMRNTRVENIQEHSLQVAMIAHGLALIKNQRYGGELDPQRTLTLAAFHEVAEVITGDLATPIKYFNPEIKTAYDHLEEVAAQRLFAMLPEELQEAYKPLVLEPAADDRIHWQLVKAADKICAYLKCVEELKAGNQEFVKAAKVTREQVETLDLPEVRYFMEKFAPSFQLTLDELN